MKNSKDIKKALNKKKEDPDLIISKDIQNALNKKRKDLKKLKDNFEVKHETPEKNRLVKVKAPIPAKELEKLLNFHEIKILFRKLTDQVKCESQDEAKLGMELIADYNMLDDVIDEIFTLPIVFSQSRSSLDWFLFPAGSRYYKPNCIIPKTRARSKLEKSIIPLPTDTVDVTNDAVFPATNISENNMKDDSDKNDKTKCTLHVDIDFVHGFECSMPQTTLKKLAKRCFEHASQLVYLECHSTAQNPAIYAAGRVYLNMEYYVQDNNENAIIHSYMTLIDEYIGDENICIHHFMTQIVNMMADSPPENVNLPRFIFFANPSHRILSLYPCALKLQFKNTTYCGIEFKKFQSIHKADKNFFKRYTEDLQMWSRDLFSVFENQFTLDSSEKYRDADNRICSLGYTVNGFVKIIVKAETQDKLCEEMEIFTGVDGHMLKKKLQECDRTSSNQRKIKKFIIDTDGDSANNQCVYNALKCAIFGLDKSKVKKLPVPCSSVSYTSPGKGLADFTAVDICHQLGFHAQYLMRGDSFSNKQRLQAVLEQSSNVASKMLLVSLEIAKSFHSHCICVDLRNNDPKIWINCETQINLSGPNLNRQCRDGFNVTGIRFILWIRQAPKRIRSHKFKKSKKMKH